MPLMETASRPPSQSSSLAPRIITSLWHRFNNAKVSSWGASTPKLARTSSIFLTKPGDIWTRIDSSQRPADTSKDLQANFQTASLLRALIDTLSAPIRFGFCLRKKRFLLTSVRSGTNDTVRIRSWMDYPHNFNLFLQFDLWIQIRNHPLTFD